MKICKIGALVSFLLVLAGATFGLKAQTLGGATVTGTVRDPSGAAVPAAEIELRDVSTNIATTTKTNTVGHYVMVDVPPGKYTMKVTAQGFRTYSLAPFAVLVGTVYTFDAALEVGAVRQTIQVEATAGAELQTLNSTMGTTVGGETILALPNLNRDATTLMLFQPMTAPTFGGTEGNITGGQIAGSMSDQTTFMLDGGNATSDLEGDNNYIASNRQYVGPQASIPTPIESIEEFKINTNNMTADFSTSAGGQIQMVTKRGNNAFHGSGYDFFQADWLNANDWAANTRGIPKIKQHQNRFGGALGGPMLPNFLGGKTYFYTNYEGRRYKNVNSTYERTVPSAMLRQGIIQIPDATGTPVAYDLKTSTGCGTLYNASGLITGPANLPCDPRGIGIAPDIQKLWTQYMPMSNELSSTGACMHGGDATNLNTCGYIAPYSLPVDEDFVVGRIDHDFGSKWRWFTSYRYYRDLQPSTNQVDIGGFLPGDKLGTAAVQSSNPLHPVYFVTGLTTNITPTVTNQFHLNYLRNNWNWIRAGVANGIWEKDFGVPGGLEVGGETTDPLAPFDFDTQDARFRTWDGHDWNYIDSVSWLRGNHFFQIGGQDVHWWDEHVRPDNVTGELTELVYQIVSNGGSLMDSTWQPQYCSSTISAGCMASGWIGTWNSLYPEMLGFVGRSQQVIARGGANLAPTGLDYLKDQSITDQYSLYFTDSWKIRPNLTLNYGLEWGVQMPPYEVNGVQDIFTDAEGNPLSYQSFMDNRVRAALNGQVYNPATGFEPIRAVGGSPKYPFDPYYGGFSPRISMAWNPSASDTGFLGKIFGNKKTVIRGGYSRLYDRSNAVNLVLTPLLGYGFGQPLYCIGGASNGTCTGIEHGVDPTDAFRIGVDGNVAPFATIAPTLPQPALPGINAPTAGALFSLDNKWRPGTNDQIDFSLQRELPGQMILEASYVGIWTKHIYLGENTDSVPFMTTLKGQTLASAWSNLYLAAYKGVAPAPQPFFEAALGGSPLCKGFSSCTAAVAAIEGPSGNQTITATPGNYTTGDSLYGFVADLDAECNGPCWTAFGGQPMLPFSYQGYAFNNVSATRGFSNYQAFVLSLQKRTGHGLMVNANFTIAHSLGTPEINDEYVEDTPNDSYNLHNDYSPTPWDRRYTFNLLSTYQLPFGKGRRWLSHNSILDRAVGGWQIAPVLTVGSGLPIEAYTGSCGELGQGQIPWCTGMVPTVNTGNIAHGVYKGIAPSTSSSTNPLGIGTNILPSNGGYGMSYYANPQAVYNDFRPYLAGIDGNALDFGPLYGMTRWNLDLTIAKQTRITERVGFTVYANMLNALNHMMWGDPGGFSSGSSSLNLQSPTYFGIINSQYGTNRIIELGLRVFF